MRGRLSESGASLVGEVLGESLGVESVWFLELEGRRRGNRVLEDKGVKETDKRRTSKRGRRHAGEGACMYIRRAGHFLFYLGSWVSSMLPTSAAGWTRNAWYAHIQSSVASGARESRPYPPPPHTHTKTRTRPDSGRGCVPIGPWFLAPGPEPLFRLSRLSCCPCRLAARRLWLVRSNIGAFLPKVRGCSPQQSAVG